MAENKEPGQDRKKITPDTSGKGKHKVEEDEGPTFTQPPKKKGTVYGKKKDDK